MTTTLLIDEKNEWSKVADTCAKLIGLDTSGPDLVFDRVMEKLTEKPKKGKKK